MTTLASVPARPDGTQLPRVRLFELDFVDAPGIEPVVEAVLAFDPGTSEALPLVVTPNVDHLVQLEDDAPAVVAATRDAAFVLPDGQPIVWASRWLGKGLRSRLTGADLFAALWDRLADDGAPALVICPTVAVADGLRQRHPGAITTVAPYFEDEDDAGRAAVVRAAIDAVGGHRPRHAFVCLGQPKQLLVAVELLQAWPAGSPVPLCYCVGAAPEMYLGLARRAPRWMRRSGLEFAFRLAREPRRLAGRYARDAIRFPGLLLAERRRR